ncbi:MAG: MMPL family transporter [Acidimicrobiia bacterium]|nr:MMPL family transporter [Acidimicrobiia bacterium]
MIARFGHWCFVHRRVTLGSWLVGMVMIFAIGNLVGSGFDGGQNPPDSETSDGFDVLDRYFGGLGTGITGAIVFEADAGVSSPDVQSAMTDMFTAADALDEVTLLDPYQGRGGGLSKNGTIGYAEVILDESIDDQESGAIGEALAELAPDIPGLRVEIGGAELAGFQPPESEVIGIAFAIVVLILATGSVLAMGLPIGLAVAGVGSGLGLVTIISNVTHGPEFATTMAVMVGLGVGIDYALFIVTRYRESLHLGLEPEAATVLAMDTAGRAVIFAGTTVMFSLLGLLLMGLPFVNGIAVAASTTVIMTMLASVTLLPALLGFAGDRIEVTRWRGLIAAGLAAVALLGVGAGLGFLLVAAPLALVVLVAGFFLAPLKRVVPARRVRPLRETWAHRWSRFVQSHPWSIALLGTTVLVIFTLPLLGIRLGFSDESNFSEDTTTRQAYDLLSEGFGPGFNGPIVAAVVAPTPGDAAALDDLVAAIGADPGVASVTPPVPNDPARPEAYVMRVVATSAPQDQATEALVNRLRSEVVPRAVDGTSLDVNLTGVVAGGIDFSDYLGRRMPLFFTAVLVLSFVLLMVVFRSLLVPLKAVVMNLLSIGAAYGIIVAVFQWGWTSAITGIEPAPIEPFIPMMMFAVVFGLSMDYEVFLLSRVKEEYDRTGDAVNSVADGLASTARVITAAAAIMVVVFGSFMLEDSRIVQLFGLGLSMAILLDASLVRMLLVPATMELLGERNWWFPRWLDRLVPRLDVEGGNLPEPDGASPPPQVDPDRDAQPVAV